jgi:ABC-type polysaccharide/polyol phosphate transport system ATPase subunit
MEVIRLDQVSLVRRTQEEFSYDLKKTLLSFLEGKYRKPTRRCVLDQINFVVEAGEKVGIIGSNGSGKSTLLKVICNILEPSSGTVRVRGNIAPLIELGAGFDPEISVVDNIVLYGVMLGFSEQEMRQRTSSILEFAELENYALVPVKALSSGMVARLGFAIATDVQPDILILDEVLSVGDESFKSKCKRRIERFWRDHSTVLIVSHDLEFIRKSCERVVWLDHGKVRMVGESDDVINTYIEIVTVKEDEEDLDTVEQVPDELEKEEEDDDIPPFGELILLPPDPPCKAAITRIFIADQHYQVVDKVGFDEVFYLGLDYQVYEPLQSLIVGCYLVNQQGTILLEPGTQNYFLKTSDIKSVGKHRFYIEIPAPLLLPGTYYIGGIGVHEEHLEDQTITTHQWVIKKLVQFDIVLTETSRHEWFGQEVIHPRLEWTVEHELS